MAARRHMSQFPHKHDKNHLRKQHKNNQDRDEKPDGRVGRLDEHTMGYYRRVADTIKDGFQDESERGRP